MPELILTGVWSLDEGWGLGELGVVRVEDISHCLPMQKLPGALGVQTSDIQSWVTRGRGLDPEVRISSTISVFQNQMGVWTPHCVVI